MASGNTAGRAPQPGEPASGNTGSVEAGPAELLPLEFAAALAGYERALRAAPLAAGTRSTYVSRVRSYLTWLATTDLDPETDGDPLEEPAARDGAVRDWRAWAKMEARLRPATINNTLAGRVGLL